MPSAMALSDVIGDRDSRSPHLAGQGVLFLRRKLPDKAIRSLPKFPSDLVQLEVIQSKTSSFHRVALTTHLLTTHLLTTHLLTTHLLTTHLLTAPQVRQSLR